MRRLNRHMKGLEKFYLTNLYTPENNKVLAEISTIIQPRYMDVVDVFYRELLGDTSARQFLDSEQVENRLKGSLKDWLADILSPKERYEMEHLIERQLQIGQVHARIDVPMPLVDNAMLMVKNGCFEILVESDMDREHLAEAIRLVNSILESSLSMINQAYMHDMVENERNAMSLRLNLSGQDIALEIERIRSDLFNWLSDSIFQVMSAQGLAEDSLQRSEFGLWVNHKMDLITPQADLSGKIKHRMDLLSADIRHLTHQADDPVQRQKEICNQMSKAANEIGWLLSELANSLLANSSKEDSLTRLIERKHMAPVLQKETQMALATGNDYSLIMCDIDHFKRINDIYGHAAGDLVLEQAAKVVRHAVRVSDYSFRYGGEEFLLVLPESSAEQAAEVAEQIRQKVEKLVVELESQRSVNISMSFGVAQFNGHPDYMRSLKNADMALYSAKHQGRNRVVMA
ncbi:GGDEF domain-containing protein [Oceanospirillum sediminis]|uniref:Diguanylate cyclase DosC n=1 Tax=Oceanospirillum sediminis TaxID=2760088 RepID=A0A839IL49_9GAMM|nr:GGDEF domain-containing protein [Oceanospirillum sediminis]MBB1485229.1 GGDEF domain-containing protein [Oceanospirillum sediminis]